MLNCRSWKTGLEFWKWRPYKVRLLVSNFIYAKRDRNGLPVPTKSLLKMSPDTAARFAPFRCTHPPPPVPPFLLTQNLRPRTLPKVTSWSWKSHDGCIRYGPEKVRAFNAIYEGTTLILLGRICNNGFKLLPQQQSCELSNGHLEHWSDNPGRLHFTTRTWYCRQDLCLTRASGTETSQPLP